MATFQLDRVKPETARMPVRALGETLGDVLAIGGDPETPVIAIGGVHPLLAAVGIAFAQHRSLVLSPDAVWLTIAQGVAQHVRLNAEALRPRLVRHDGRKRLALTWPGAMPSDAASWAAVVSAFRGLLADEIGDGRARLFECEFSTTTDVERVASQIILFDAYSPYYSLWMKFVCGIPWVTLTGTVADWRRIRERIDVLAELDLASWCRSLIPITDQFVRAADGDVDLAFWQRIYSPVDAYGGEVITGWITRLYPYLKRSGAVATPNPMLELPIDEPSNLTSTRSRGYSGPGIRSSDVPVAASRVTVRITDQVGGEQRAVALVAGVVAVAQDGDGSLRPIAGWHLERATVVLADVIDRMVRDHRVTLAPTDDALRPPLEGPEDEGDDDRIRIADRLPLEGPAEVIEMFSRLDSAILFKGSREWRVRPVTDHDWISIEGAGTLHVQRVFDLPGSRSLCYAADRDEVHWLLCRVASAGRFWKRSSPPTTTDAPADIPMLGTSLAAILDAALEGDGEIDHLEVGRLDQLLQQQRVRGR